MHRRVQWCRWKETGGERTAVCVCGLRAESVDEQRLDGTGGRGRDTPAASLLCCSSVCSASGQLRPTAPPATTLHHATPPRYFPALSPAPQERPWRPCSLSFRHWWAAAPQGRQQRRCWHSWRRLAQVSGTGLSHLRGASWGHIGRQACLSHSATATAKFHADDPLCMHTLLRH